MSQPYRTPSDIHPSLTYYDAPAAIDWLCKAFGFTKRFVVPGPNNRKRFVVPGPNNRIEHSELSLGTGVVMISSPKSRGPASQPQGPSRYRPGTQRLRRRP